MPMNLCEVMRAAGDLDGAAAEIERATKLFADYQVCPALSQHASQRFRPTTNTTV